MGKAGKVKAYLTVYMTLSLTVLLAVVMVLLTGVKKNTIRMEEELALNTAGNSALAEYDQELFRQYDLFFIDTSYGTDHARTEKIGDHVMNYANKNLENTKLFESKMICADIQEVELATDNGGEVLKQQIIDYEKNYFGIEALEQLFSDYKWSETEEIGEEELIQKRDENADKLSKEKPPVRTVEKERYHEESGEMEIYEEKEEVSIEDPAAYVNELRKRGILSLVVDDTSKISGKAIRPEEYVSHRSDLLQ